MDVRIEITEKSVALSVLYFADINDVDDVILALQAFQYEYDAQRDAKTHDNN